MSLKHLVRRWRFSLTGSLTAVAVLAVVFAMTRPFTEAEVIRIADRKFLKIPGAAAWDGCPRRAVRLRAGWCVEYIDPERDGPFAQMMVDEQGNANDGGVVLATTPALLQQRGWATGYSPTIPPPRSPAWGVVNRREDGPVDIMGRHLPYRLK